MFHQEASVETIKLITSNELKFGRKVTVLKPVDSRKSKGFQNEFNQSIFNLRITYEFNEL